MNPYCKLALKSCAAFVLALGTTTFVHRATGQISLYDWLALLWPGVLAVALYWTGVCDSTPAPWVTPTQAYAAADKLAAATPPNGGS